MQDYIDIVTDVIIGVIVSIVTKQKTNSTRKKYDSLSWIEKLEPVWNIWKNFWAKK